VGLSSKQQRLQQLNEYCERAIDEIRASLERDDLQVINDRLSALTRGSVVK
jgi:hypothetical protein